MKNLAFGDSITAGTGASTFASSYIGLLDADFALTFDDAAVSTSMVMDQANALYARTTSAGDRSVVMLGTNDQAKYDVDATKRGYYIDGLRAFAAYLGADSKIANATNGVTFSGSWGNGYAFGVYASTVVGDTATFNTSGDSAFIGMLRQYNNASSFQVTIDGTIKGTFATGGDVRTILGRAYGPMCLGFYGLGSGPHAIEIKVMSGGDPVYFHWFASQPKASVYFINTPHALAYTYGGSSSNVDAYNTALAALVSELSVAGMSVHLVDVCSVLTAADMADNVHPNNSGHAKIRYQTYIAMTGAAPPPAMTATTLYSGSDGNFYVLAGSGYKKIALS